MASYLNLDQIGSVSGTLSTETSVNLSLENNNTFMLVPKGTTAQRDPNPPNGAIRWNTDINNFEVWNGVIWRVFRRIFDFSDVTKSSLIVSLDTADKLSYPESGGRKWFDNGFETFKAVFPSDPTFNTNNRGYIEFDGSTTYATIDIDDAGRLTPTGGITQECWFKLDAAPTSSQVFIGLQYGISSNNAYALYVDSTLWRAGVNIAGTFTEITHPFSSTPLQAGQWYHFVHTYRNSTYANRFRCSTTAGSTTLVNVDDFTDLIIGASLTGPYMDNSVTSTTIVSFNKAENQIEISNPATDTGDGIELTATLPECQMLFVNGEQVGNFSPLAGNIDYNANNTAVTIGGDFNGPGANTGVFGFVDGGISTIRLYNVALLPSQIKNNFDVIKGRYGY